MNLQPLNRQDLQWCLQRAPKKVLELLKKYPNKSCVAGGFIRSCVANETINDIDIFAQDKATARAMADWLAVNPGGDLRAVYTTDNAYTVRGFFITPQIVHRWTFEDVVDVMSSFDFTIARAMFFWCARIGQWVGYCDPRFYADLAAKRLVYCSPVRNEDAGGSMLRVLKFYQRGYRIPLDSLGAVMARMCSGCKNEDFLSEEKLGLKLTDLLREVDPAIDPEHIAHLPA